MPATPRRPVDHVDASTATSSSVTIVATSRAGQVGGHLEIHHVALVVLDDEDAAAAGVDGLDGRHHLVGSRRREHLTGAGGVEHAEADEAGVQRLVPGTAAGNRAPPCRPSASRRRTNLRSAPSATMSACAAANPSRLSARMLSVALIEFLHDVLPDVLILFNDMRQTTRDFGDGLVQQAVAPRIAQIGQRQRELARDTGFPDEFVAPRVRLRIRDQEIAPISGGEVTDLEDRLEDAAPESVRHKPDWRSAR